MSSPAAAMRSDALPDPSSAQGALAAARAALLATVDIVPIYQLSIELETLAPIELSPFPGSAIRGALVQALLDTHCTNKAARTCAECPLVRVCPVAALVAPLREEAPRGRDVPRPFTITPPALPSTVLDKGTRWMFGLTLFGSAAALFPYVVLARARIEANGLGLRNEAGRRGRIAVRRITSLTADGETDLYSHGGSRIAAPIANSARDVIATRAAGLPTERLTLRFTTPVRLVNAGTLQRRVLPAVLVHRLLERWEAIRREYATPGSSDPLAPLRGTVLEDGQADPRALLAIADRVDIERDETHWVELASYSSRLRRFTPISGLVGDLTLSGPLEALREVLALGELIHVGKDVVKGNGCFTLQPAPLSKN